MSLIAELQRRNVFKVGAAYLALAWVVTQITGAVVPALHLPESINSMVVWLGLIGFPFVVVFAWIYELTPEGLKRESEVDRSQSITHVTSRRLDYTIIALLVIAIGLFVLQYFRPATADAPPAAAPAASASANAPAVAADDKSIAVLPFVNMSEDANNAFFADGISEELLNLLARVPQLRVIARTSSFSYKGKDVKVSDVARELNVAHVLEGSVRKSGNRVPITVQLVRASDSSHLWSQDYDRTLDDIFAVQDQIAAAVVDQLKVTLLGEAPKVREVDREAYSQFLQARALSRLGTAQGWEQAVSMYQQALARQADYPEALVNLADTYLKQSNNSLRDNDEASRLAREAATRALAIDPNSAQAHYLLGYVASTYDADLQTAADQYTRALELGPNDAELLVQAATLLRSLDRVDAAVTLGRLAAERDPANPVAHYYLGASYQYAGRLDDSLASLRTALSLAPGRIGVNYFMGETLLLKGDNEAALASIEQESSPAWHAIGLPMAYRALGRKQESDAALAVLIRDFEHGAPFNIAYVLAFRGETDRAFEWLDKAVLYKDSGLVDLVGNPFLAPLTKDPRWLPFLQRIGRAPEQLAAIRFDVKLPP